MPDPVERVKREGQSHQELQPALHQRRELGETLSERCGLNVPAQQGGNEVREAEYVEAAREDGAGDAVESGQGPGNLSLVDGEVGRDGPVEALAVKYGVTVVEGDFVGRGDGFGGGGSVRKFNVWCVRGVVEIYLTSIA